MIRSLIAWALKNWLSKRLPKTAAALVEAALNSLDEIAEQGDDAVIVDTSGAKPRISIRPADPGAKPNTLDDILNPRDNV